MKKPTLWTKNFTVITLGTLVSAIGGVAMSLGLSLVVFDQTQSTWLSGIYAAVSMLPGMTLPILLAPAIDRVNRKHVIVGLDAFNGVLYLAFLAYIHAAGFAYGAYLLFSLATGCIGSVYGLAYNCLYPDLIPKGLAQKGYAVSGMIYPLATTLITPLAAIVYARWGIELLFFLEGCLLLLAAAFESQIDYIPVRGDQQAKQKNRGWSGYWKEMREGFAYLHREKGVRSIFTYMMITNSTGGANGAMAMAHFQRTPLLTTAMYGLLASAETLGRVVGSALHYAIEIPEEKHYAMTVKVYAVYELFDGIMLFVAYPVMLVLRFACGFLGVQTAAMRTAAVQNYIPADMRARVNGLFSVLICIGGMLAQLLAGALGELLPCSAVAAVLASFSMLCMLLIIVRRRRDVKPVYNRHV